ncbi:MAG: helix-turn-helix transcriptional regulator [Clostridia bacterium]|nr:helix-turn-helix transcriptional regulator [Clostridia bacterium]
MRNRKLLQQYLIKAISLSLISCIVVGGMLFWLSSYYLKREAEMATQERLESVMHDFNNMINTMDEIANQIKVDVYYQPFYLNKNDYNKVLLLERFSMFGNWHPLISNYFLYYPGENLVFSREHAHNYSIFTEQFLSSRAESVTQLLAEGKRILEFSGKPDHVYYVHPIHFLASSQVIDAYLMYEIDKQHLKEYFMAFYNVGATLEIAWNQVLLCPGEHAEERMQSTRIIAGDTVAISAAALSEEVESEWNLFLRIFLILIICLMAISSLLAMLTAYSIYRPIQRLLKKIGVDEDEEKNEIVKLERYLDALHADKQDTLGQLLSEAKQISRLTSALRRFIFLRIINGEKDEKLEEHSTLVGIDLNYSCFQALYIPFSSEIDDEALCECIENFHTGLVSLYVVRLTGDVGWCVVACTQDRAYLDKLDEDLEEKLIQQGFAAQIYAGSVCVQLKELPRSLLHAENAVNEESTAKNNRYTTQLLTFLQSGNQVEAEICLKNIFQNLQSTVQSNLMLRYCLVNLFHQLVVTAEKAQCDISEYEIQGALLTGDLEDFFSSMHAMIGVICEKNAKNDESKEGENVISYIQKHAFENGLSLDIIASAFQISTRHVARLIRTATGATYKEYLTQLRMAKALELTKTNLSTAEIAIQVGYADEHHFMKLFREQTGCTISQYRMRNRDDGEETNQ